MWVMIWQGALLELLTLRLHQKWTWWSNSAFSLSLPLLRHETALRLSCCHQILSLLDFLPSQWIFTLTNGFALWEVFQSRQAWYLILKCDLLFRKVLAWLFLLKIRITSFLQVQITKLLAAVCSTQVSVSLVLCWFRWKNVKELNLFSIKTINNLNKPNVGHYGLFFWDKSQAQLTNLRWKISKHFLLHISQRLYL